ncbi:MAG: glycosyltransferase family 4 protein [Verrucomicrobiota bacterium]|nr:glycosyltransferase family 4 protein [Verrucomicrobiota bacterium]MDP6252816.1 glycosyltransferase family 4 protein [Verrucomicrobiota bacterium]MDP7176897.1 glycosyltransferase family 4 protein [Verrucomicrobiota bacterium]MDP7291723.1 glycosyltransferase family 4 protein [Verrucomicrobiota bacterium]
MNIVQITPGAGSMYCGNCFRDNALVAQLRRMGHHALMVPMYLPLTLDEADQSEGTPLFFSVLNVYLAQKFNCFKIAPNWLRRMFTTGWLLNRLGNFAGKTRGADVGDLMLSMMRGESGHQARELEQLIAWLREHEQPDVICLSNALIAGLAKRLRAELGVPVVCLLEGEDAFLDSLPSPQREQTWAELRERVTDIDLFIAPTRYYADTMAQRAGIPAAKLEHINNGINLDGFEPSSLPDDPPVLGYFARMCPEKGLDSLIDAFVRLKQTGPVPALKLAVGGGCQPGDRAYVEKQKGRLRDAGLLGEATFLPNLDRDAKLAFYRGLTVLSVPALYGESFGLYVVEAMASGVPVVAPDDASFPELIEQNQAGTLCAKGDPQALADAIGQLLLDREHLAKCAAAGRQAAVQTFNIERMAGAFVARLAKLS